MRLNIVQNLIEIE